MASRHVRGGRLGGVATNTSINEWYQELQRPAWTPPDWVFGPVWTVLYAMMAVAAWLVWRQDGFAAAARWPLSLYLVQLAIVAAIVAFWRRSVVAGVLMLPYLGWVTFAAALNFGFAWLNS